MGKRCYKVSYRLAEKDAVDRKALYNQIRESVNLPELSEADIVQAALEAFRKDKKFSSVFMKSVVKVLREKYPL